MQYPQTAAPAPNTSLVNDSASVNERLQELYSRLLRLNDSLHGSHPRDASGTGKLDEQQSLRRNISKMFGQLSEIENELSEIESKL